MLYGIAILAHSWLRWGVLLAMLGRLGLAIADRSSGRAYEKRARIASAVTVGLLDLTLVLGVVLLSWLSPLTTSAMADMGSAMSDPLRRFWLVEHPTMMFLASVVAHVGTAIAKRAEPRRAHTMVILGLSLAKGPFGF